MLRRFYGPTIFYVGVALFQCCLLCKEALFFDVVLALN